MREATFRSAYRDYPRFQFITYAYDDPDEAPVLEINRSLAEARQGERGFVYRVERLTEPRGANTEYGNEEFIEVLGAGERKTKP